MDDLDTLGPALAPYLDSLYPYLERFYNLEREKSDKAVTKLSEDAVKHLQMLESESLTATRKQTVISLKEIFEATKAGKYFIRFQPTYLHHLFMNLMLLSFPL